MPEFQTKRRLLSRLGRPLAITLLAAAGAVDLPRCQNSPPDLTTLGIEAVMNMEVTSVSKKPEKFMDTTAAVYVITAEDIRRSGATSLPELLRLVPACRLPGSIQTRGRSASGASRARFPGRCSS